MVLPQPAQTSVTFVDDYCQSYRHLFREVRTFEAFKGLHLGIISELSRKSLPQIARAVGLKDGQARHHFLRDAPWEVSQLRSTRLWLIKQLIGNQPITLCIDETGDVKKGQATDYVAKQYIGNLGKTENGIVSVNAYALVNGLTYPLLFKIFKPRHRLKAGDEYKTKPQIAVEILQELKAYGFTIELVLADSLYGESGDVTGELSQQQLPYIVAIRSNHPVLMPKGWKVRYNRWHGYQQALSHRQSEQRWIREIIFGKPRQVRFFQITKGEIADPDGDSWYIMTNLKGKVQRELARLYSLRNWIEYGFKQVKNELGWADFRLTDYGSIERWWEIIFSAYLMVSLQADYFQSCLESPESSTQGASGAILECFGQPPWWEAGITWKSALNTLRLIIQPYIFYCLLAPWLEVFSIPGLRRGFFRLMRHMNCFRGSPKLSQPVAA
jgi:SRSO17 transposase